MVSHLLQTAGEAGELERPRLDLQQGRAGLAGFSETMVGYQPNGDNSTQMSPPRPDGLPPVVGLVVRSLAVVVPAVLLVSMLSPPVSPPQFPADSIQVTVSLISSQETKSTL